MRTRVIITLALAICGCAQRQPLAPDTMLAPFIADAERGVSWLESAALRDARLTAAQAAEAGRHLREHPDHTSYLMLGALRRDFPERAAQIPSATRAAILCAALGRLNYLNDWGYLEPSGSHDGPAAKALLECGPDALPFLAPFLKDTRPAPLFGSEEATLSSLHQYRRADFAFRYAALLLGETPAFAPAPPARDAAIAGLLRRMASAPAR